MIIDPLATREIGTTGLRVSQLGLGGAPLGDFSSRLVEEEALATRSLLERMGADYEQELQELRESVIE